MICISRITLLLFLNTMFDGSELAKKGPFAHRFL